MDALERLQNIDRSTEIKGLSISLYFWSRDPRILAAITVVVVALGVAVGWFLAPAEKRLLPADQLRAELARPQPDPGQIVATLATGYSSATASSDASLRYQPVEEWIKGSKLGETDKAMFLAFADSVEDGGEPNADLLWYAHQPGAPRFANETIGDLHASAQLPDKALRYYQREGRNPAADTARDKAIALLVAKRDFPALKALLATPEFQPSRKPAYLAEVAASERRWGELPAHLNALQLSLFEPLPVALAALAAVVWLAVVLQSIQPPRLFCFRTLVPLLAVAAGMLSTWPTLFAGIWEDHVWWLREGGGMLGDVRFYVLGVGVREELLKLAFFLPFLPVLLVRKDRLEALCIAGCVGLGFAAAENLLYFQQSGAASAMGRFLTANFFHTAATGLIGLALFDALLDPVKRGWVFLATLVALMVAHGLYDAFLSFAQMRSFETLSGMVFMFTSLAFFRRLRPLRSTATDQLNIAGTFVAGISVLIAVVFASTAMQLGFELAVAVLAVSGVTLAMIIYMFYWLLGEGMSAGEETHCPSYSV